MKYVVTLKDKTYEVEVEEGEAMILDEYEVKAPAAPAPAAAPAAAAGAASFLGSQVMSLITPMSRISAKNTTQMPMTEKST